MKKKFDFSAEMSEVESIKTTPKNEYLEEEKRLLDVNAKELASLNDNVYKLRIEVENLSGSIRKCKEAERRIKKADNAIHIPATAFYILIIIVVALSSFFVCMIVANAEILHSGLIWKAVICCILIAVLGIGIALIVQKFLDRGK